MKGFPVIEEDEAPQAPPLQRYLQTHSDDLRTMKQNIDNGLAARHMFAWTPLELASVIREFKSGITIPKIAVNHLRSISSINAKLGNAGLIDNSHNPANKYFRN